jgi:hypothetical protein
MIGVRSCNRMLNLAGNVREDANAKPWFLWGPIKREQNQILAWRPDVGKFKALGKSGRLLSQE